MMSEIANNALLPPQLANNRGLVNTYSGQKALLDRQLICQGFVMWEHKRLNNNHPSPS